METMDCMDSMNSMDSMHYTHSMVPMDVMGTIQVHGIYGTEIAKRKFKSRPKCTC